MLRASDSRDCRQAPGGRDSLRESEATIRAMFDFSSVGKVESEHETGRQGRGLNFPSAWPRSTRSDFGGSFSAGVILVRGVLLKPQLSYWALCDNIAFSICAFTASRLKLAPFCIGGNSIAVWASFPTSCCAYWKRQNS
jgi:hypothetical protein